MKNNISRYLYIGVFLLILLMPSEFSAATLRTKSGKVYNNYEITNVLWDIVVVFHTNGIARLKHEELPQDILERYSEEIERKKKQHFRRVASAIRRNISQAKEEADCSVMIEKLKKIKKQYPHHPLIAEVDKLIEEKKQADSIEKSIRSIISKGAIGKQIAQLQQLLKKTSDPGQIKEINLLLTEKKDLQKNHAAVIDNLISLAAAQEIPEDAIRELKNILGRYPEYPFPEQQKNYLAKIDQLISEKQNEQDNAKQKKADRHSAYIQQNPDAETLLKNMFLHELEYDRELSKKILMDSLKLADGINNARKQSPEKAVSMLNEHLNNSGFAVNKADALKYKAKMEQMLRQAAEREAKLAAIRKIKVRNGSGGDLVIEKSINRNTDWKLWLVPVSEKELVYQIWNKYREYQQDRENRIKYYNQANDNRRKGVYYAEAAASYMQLSTQYFESAKKKLKEAQELTNTLHDKITFDLESDRCSLFNISAPVILLALQRSIIIGTELVSYCWYNEYTPGRSNNYWEISEAY